MGGIHRRVISIFIYMSVLLAVSACDADTQRPVSSQQASAGVSQSFPDSEHTVSPTSSSTSVPAMAGNGTELEWPEGFIPGVPRPYCGIAALQYDETLIDTYETEKGPQYVRVELDGMGETDADALIDGIKAGGYTKNAIYEKNGQFTKYYAQDGGNVESHRVLFKWLSNEKTALIILLKPGWAALDGYLANHRDDTADEDLSPWPEGFLPNCPRPIGKIVDVSYTQNDTPGIESETCAVSLYFADRQSVAACIAEMKKRYYVEPEEVNTEAELSYDAVSDFYDGGKFDQAVIIFWSEGNMLSFPSADVTMIRAR